jgi:hypothetical protein
MQVGPQSRIVCLFHAWSNSKKTTTYRFCDGASESSTKCTRCISSSADDMFRVAARDLKSCGVRNYALVGARGRTKRKQKEGSRKYQESKEEYESIKRSWCGGPHHKTQSCARKLQHTSPQLIFRVGHARGLRFPAPLLFPSESTGVRLFPNSAFSPQQHLLLLPHPRVSNHISGQHSTNGSFKSPPPVHTGSQAS